MVTLVDLSILEANVNTYAAYMNEVDAGNFIHIDNIESKDIARYELYQDRISGINQDNPHHETVVRLSKDDVVFLI